jgi:peptide/nickel transport system permease protein
MKRSFIWGGITLASVGGIAIIACLTSGYHLLGTDKVGDDVFYRALKGVRTGLIIGGFTTLIAIPFAIFFGVIAGYFGGRVDDVVQYLYSTLASIPDILLIAAFMLLFGRGLFNLCLIMGITSWTGLCRLLRGETLKLRELEYVQAAEAFGVSRAKIILRHIVPNVMHIVLISFILRFSGLVLAEALLSYLQIGVDPTTGSWGNMINTARLELAREPVVWWNLAAAFVFMFGLVLPANLFGDAVRDALDPRLRTE